MRALTVQQPWAWAIVHGGKDVENRTQAWGYRGPLAIHAGMRLSERGRESPLVVRAVGDAMRSDSGFDFHYGAILGVVDLVDVHPWFDCIDAGDDMCSPWAEAAYDEHGGRTRRDVVHLVLADPRPLEVPIPCKGRLGLWTPPGRGPRRARSGDRVTEMADHIALAVETAARDAVADQGGMVTGFVALVTYLDEDGDRAWSLAIGQEQGMAASLGMVEILSMMVRAQIEAAYFAGPEVDE